jgi:2'-5' RNA ligase
MINRAFIGVNLPEKLRTEINGRLAEILTTLPSQAIRPTVPENLHLTLEFLGGLDDPEEEKVKTAIRETAEKFVPPEIEFDRIDYGPNRRLARMIWLFGRSEELAVIQRHLRQKLAEQGIRVDNRPFSLHLTLARIKDPESPLPEIGRETKFSFRADKIELMSSVLNEDHPRYASVFSVDFGGDKE